ncbi:ATP-binding protein [Hydrogenophaga atypica]|uniref:ATP-binding protein n=1 Tax=Hydrogenophaga atypica TaxID=249409 RepID=A0ABW2QJ18_9BURK
MKPRRAPPLPHIDPARCTGCGWCAAVCPPHVLSLVPMPDHTKTSVLHNVGGCTGCSLCETRCPFQAITMQAATTPRAPAAPGPGPSPGTTA